MKNHELSFQIEVALQSTLAFITNVNLFFSSVAFFPIC